MGKHGRRSGDSGRLLIVALVVVGLVGAALPVVEAGAFTVLPPDRVLGAGLATLAGNGDDDQVDGDAATAEFDTLGSLKLNADGSIAYVVDLGPPRKLRSVSMVDGETDTVYTFPSGVTPNQIDVDSSGVVYVGVSNNGDKELWTIDPSTSTVIGDDESALIYNMDEEGFALSADESEIYYFQRRIECLGILGCPNLPQLYSIGIAGGDGDSGTDLGRAGHYTRDGGEIVVAPDGTLYLSWYQATNFNTLGYPPILYRYDGSFVELDKPFGQQSIAVDPIMGTLFSSCRGNGAVNNCDTASSIVSYGVGGTSDGVTIAGDGPGFAEGLNGKLDDPVSIDITPDGSIMVISDQDNHRIRLLDVSRFGRAARHFGQAKWMGIAGDPVNAATGNFVYQPPPDLGSPGAYGVGLARTYNSQDPAVGQLGVGWSMNLAARLVHWSRLEPADADVYVRMDDGREVRFTNDGTNSWVPDRGLIGAALAHSSGVFELTFSTGEVWSFDDTTGMLSEMADGQGQVAVVARDGSGNITSVTNAAAGRRLGFSVVSGDVVAEALVPDGSGGWMSETPARAVTFDLEGGLLVGTADGDGAGERYTWGSGGMIEAVEQRVGPSTYVPVIENTYDSFARVTDQITGTGASTVFEYDTPAANRTRATHDATPGAAGGEEVIIYTFDEDGLLAGVEDPNANSTGSAWFEGELVAFTDRRDAEYVSIFDGEGRLAHRVFPDPATGVVRQGVKDFADSGGVSGSPPSAGAGDVFESFVYVGSGDVRVATHRSKGGEVMAYAYDGAETIPSVVEVRDPSDPGTASSSLQRTCVDSADGLVSKVIEGAALGCGSGLMTTEHWYGAAEPGGASAVADCPVRLLCITVVARGTADESWTVYAYDDAGRVGSVTEAYGTTPGGGSPGATTTTYTYDGAGRVVEVASPVTNPGAGVFPVTYGYDLAGRVLWQSAEDNPYSGTTGFPSVAYTYTADGQVETETTYLDTSTGAATVTVNVYDNFGQLTETRVADGTADESVTTFEYGPLGRLEAQTTAAGTGSAVRTGFEYDADGNQIRRVVDPDDGTGDPELHLASATGFDAAGRVVCETDPGDVGHPATGEIDCSPSDHVIDVSGTGGTFDLWVWDDDANTEVADLAWNVSTGSLQSALAGVVAGTTVSGTAGDTYTVTWGDGEHHRVVPVTDNLTGGGLTVVPSRSMAVAYGYDAAGRVVRRIDTPGETTQRVTDTVFDGAGRVHQTLTETGVVGDSSGLNPYRFGVVSEAGYDTAGRQTTMTVPPPDVQAFAWNPANGTTTTTGFDDAGRVESRTTAAGTAVEVTVGYRYDAHGWMLGETDAADPGLEATFAYDGLGRVVRTDRPHGDGDTTGKITTYTPTGQVATETDWAEDPTAGGTPTRSFGYNPAGWLISATDANGTTVTYGHDLRGNRTKRTSTQTLGAAPDCGTPGTVTCIDEIWVFDSADRVVGHTFLRDDTNTTTVATAYDPAGRVKSTVEPVASGVDRTATHTYVAHQLTQTAVAVTAGGSDTFTFAYDPAGRRATATNTFGATGWSYDLAGNVAARSNPVGGDIAHGWSLRGQPRFTDHTGTQQRYSHDAQGRLQATELWIFGVWFPMAAYTYDDAGRALSETYLDDALVFAQYERDDGGNVTGYLTDHDGVDVHEYHLTVGYDSRVRGVCEDTTANATCDSDPVEYLYDPAGQLRAAGEGCEWDAGNPDTDCDQTWGYDGAGNRTTQTDGATSIAWDTNRANQVIERAVAGGTTTTYTYNWAGDRTGLVENDGTTDIATVDYQWGPDGYLAGTESDHWYFGQTDTTEARDATGTLAQVTYGAMELDLLWDTTLPVPQVAYFEVPDQYTAVQSYGLRRIHTNAGLFVYDWMDNTIESDAWEHHPTHYTPWGEPVGLGAFFPFFGYRSEFHIGAGIHLRNRQYDPTTGTFLTRDPLDGEDGTPTVSNPYHYADNDPLNKVDPMGLKPDRDCSYGMAGCVVVEDDKRDSYGISATGSIAGSLGLTTDMMVAYRDSIYTSSSSFGTDLGALHWIVQQESGGRWTSGTEDAANSLVDPLTSAEVSRGITNIQQGAYDIALHHQCGLNGSRIRPFVALSQDAGWAIHVASALLSAIDCKLMQRVREQPNRYLISSVSPGTPLGGERHEYSLADEMLGMEKLQYYRYEGIFDQRLVSRTALGLYGYWRGIPTMISVLEGEHFSPNFGEGWARRELAVRDQRSSGLTNFNSLYNTFCSGASFQMTYSC